MASGIKIARPGVVLRKRIAREPKRCVACGCLIKPGEGYCDKKRSWERYSQPVCERCG